jgi:hypothetical protein
MLVTVKQFAEAHNISASHLYKKINKFNVPVKGNFRANVYDESDLVMVWKGLGWVGCDSKLPICTNDYCPSSNTCTYFRTPKNTDRPRYSYSLGKKSKCRLYEAK